MDLGLSRMQKNNISVACDVGLCAIKVAVIAAAALCLCGCTRDWAASYSNEWPYPDEVGSVYVEMFDSTSFRRGHEYDLTDAVCKRIEAQTPYKVVSDRSRADTLLSGHISAIGEAVLSGERQTGRPLEREFRMQAVISWKNLQTGDFLIDNQQVAGSVSFSTLQEQGRAYASSVAANRLAERIVEMMQSKW